MAANQFLSLPQAAAGNSFASAASAWGYGAYSELVSVAGNTIGRSITGFQFQVTNIPALDTTHELIFDISTGAAAAEVVKIQVPYSFRNDTAEGYYHTQTFKVFLPEPVIIAGGSRISVRAADTLVTAITYNGVKLFFEELPPTLSQTAYRYYEDGTETASTVIAAQNTNITRDVTADSNLQLRVRLQETIGSPGAATDDYQLQYDKNASGMYDNIGTRTIAQYPEINAATNLALDNTVHGSAQSFSGIDSVLSSIVVRSRKEGTPTGNALAKIYAHSGTFGTSSVPTGSALATSDNFDVSTLTTTQSLVTFTFTGGNKIALSSGTNYVLAIEYTGGSAVNTMWLTIGNLSNPGNRSDASTSFSWTAFSGTDLIFYVYGDGILNGFNSASLTDGAATTNRLTAGTGSFVAGEIAETGLVTDSQITASNYTELLYSLTIASAAVANADILDFRVLRNGLTTDMTYTVTPRITVSKGAATAINQFLLLGIG